jgi:hypothetical protein
MNINNSYYIGFIIAIAAYITLVFPEVHEYVQELFGGVSASEQAKRYADFVSLLIHFGVFYFLTNWFSGKYR